MSKKLSTQEKARRLWVRALRSGKYGWGKSELRPKQDKFCCLGVLCEVAVKKGVIKSYNPQDRYVPVEVQYWAGLVTSMGDFDKSIKYCNNLGTLNDESRRNPFVRIASLIEKRPAGLFFTDEDQA